MINASLEDFYIEEIYSLPNNVSLTMLNLPGNPKNGVDQFAIGKHLVTREQLEAVLYSGTNPLTNYNRCRIPLDPTTLELAQIFIKELNKITKSNFRMLKTEEVYYCDEEFSGVFVQPEINTGFRLARDLSLSEYIQNALKSIEKNTGVSIPDLTILVYSYMNLRNRCSDINGELRQERDWLFNKAKEDAYRIVTTQEYISVEKLKSMTLAEISEFISD